MKTDFLLAITQLAAERNLPKEVVFTAVEAALATAFKKDEGGANQNISVKINPGSGDVRVFTAKIVVEEPTDTLQEMSLAEAKKLKKDVKIGDTISLESTPFHTGRIAAQTAKQVVLQRLREAEREFIYGEFVDKEGDVVGGVVQRIEPRHVVIDLGKTEGILPVGEQLRTERYRVGQRLKLYLLNVNRTNRGPRLIMSRSYPDLVRRLFELEVPEIYSGTVEIKGIAREAGYRCKVAVTATQEGLDPVGSCVGLRGVRIQNVVNELNGERIDVIEWNADPKLYIANALSPAQVVRVDINEEENTAIVVVPDNQLSLAIGKEGQNARLAARITGWRIDIKSATAAEADREALKPEEPAEKVLAEEMVEAVMEKPLAVTLPPGKYAMPVEQLGLSSRTFKLLTGNGITKVGELLGKSDNDLLELKSFGQKSLEEVRERLEAFDLLPRPSEGEVELPWGEVEAIAEEPLDLLQEVEEELEVIPYESPPEESKPAEKPKIRFAEDIFVQRAEPVPEGKKKGKKKKSGKGEASDEGGAKRGRKARKVVSLGEDYEDEDEDENEELV